MKVIKKKINKHLFGKVIYLIVCGAKKVEIIDQIVEDFLNEKAKIFLFPTYPAKQMIKPDRLNKLAKKIEIREDFSWYGANTPLLEEDLVLVCPCTFNTLIKMSLGIADDYPLSIIHSAIARGKKVLVAPAFNEYWYHPATQEAIQRLTSWGVTVIWPQITKDKVTMMDYRKITDYAYSELQKIKFHSEKVDSLELKKILNNARKKYFKSFLEVGKHQHLDYTNSSKHGCYSIRLNNDWILISASGCNLSKITPGDLVLVGINSPKDTIRWHGDKQPSSESPLHINFYSEPGYDAVIHSHNPAVTYNDELEHLKTPEYVTYGVFEGSKKIFEQVKKQNGFVILRYHGEITAGKDLESAYNNYLKNIDS